MRTKMAIRSSYALTRKLTGKDGFYGWVNLGVMFFFNAALMPMMMAFTFFLPYWIKEFGWRRDLASGAQTLSMILSGLAAPLVAVFIMKQGTKRAIVAGNLLSIVGLVLLAFQNHIWQLYLGIGVFLGLGVSIGGMLAMMTVINNWFIAKRPLALSISMASMGFSGVFISPMMMALIETMGWRNTYLLLAAAALIFCVIFPALLIKEKPEDLGQVPDGPGAVKPAAVEFSRPVYRNLYKTPVDFTAKEALRTITLWLLVAYSALRFFVMMGSGLYIIDFQFEIGISAKTAGFIGGVFSAVMGLSQLSVGYFGLLFKMHRLIIVAMFLGLIGFSFLLFAQSVPFMLAYAIIFGASAGIGAVAMGNLYPDYFGRTEFPKIMGYTMPFNTFISCWGGPLTGYIRQTTGSYTPAFKVLFALLVLASFCIIFAKPPVHPSLKGKVPEITG
jgi:MFS family permease